MTRPSPPPGLIPIPRQGIAGLPGILLCLLIALAAAIPPIGLSSYVESGTYLPLAAVEGIAVAGLVLMGMYILRTVRMAGGMFPLLLTVTILLVFAFGSVIPAAILVSWLFVVSEGALLVATADRRIGVMLPLLPLAAVALSIILCGRWQAGLLCLLPFPGAVTLALGTRSSAAREDGLTRVGVTCATTLALGVTVTAVAAGILYARLGTLDPETLLAMLDALRTSAIALLTDAAATAGGALAELVTPTYAADTVNSLFNLLPGYAVAALLIFTAVAQMILLAALHANGYGNSITDRVRLYRISAVTGIVYLASYILMIVSLAGEESMATTVAHNLVIILQPGLALGGLLHLVARLSARGPRSGCAPLILLIAPALLLIAPTVLAVFEGIVCASTPFRSLGTPPPDDTNAPPRS